MVVQFLLDHREGFAAFLVGALSDPVAGDLYDFAKEFFGYRHLVPPVPNVDSARNFIPTAQQTRDLRPPLGANHYVRIYDAALAEDLHVALRKRLEYARAEEYSQFYYFPFDSKDPALGFIEVVLPPGRSASGNGDIYILRFMKNEYRVIGQMSGNRVEADLRTRPTALITFFHNSGFHSTKTRYEYRDGFYVRGGRRQ